MTLFWFLAAAMVAVALGFVLVPLLRARASGGPSQTEANLEVLRGQRREIEADVAAGLLPAEAKEEALAELVGRAADDLSGRDEAVAASPRRPWPLAAAVAVLVPAVALGIYLAVGSPRALDAVTVARADHDLSQKQVVAMVETLAAKMKERPDDPRGWSLLARSMASLGRFEEAADAYGHLVKLVTPDAQMLADYADALGMAQGRSLAGKPGELIAEALRLDPRNQKALALAGTAALDAKDYPTALRHWQTLASLAAPGSEDEREVAAVVEDVRKQAAAAGVTLPSAAAAASTAKVASAAAPKPAAAGGGTVSGSVKLAPDIASRLSGGETVFILARAEGGPKVPLAVIKASAKELPLKFALDDSQAMSPGMNISSAEAVRVEARVSRSGEAMQRSGDFVGASAVVKPGARDVVVLVDRVVP